MTLLLTGGSGFLGRHVLAQLEGQPLRLFVLPDDPALPELRKQAEVVTGDVTRPEGRPDRAGGPR
jgi:nucleoside-diphosphate-sugar epimerase